MADLRYRHGAAMGFVSDDLCLVVEEVADDQHELLWELASSHPDVVRLLDVLGVGGIAAMPSFAAVVLGADQVRVVARGRLSVEVDADGVVRECDGAHVSTWSERAFPAAGVRGFRIRAGAPTDAPALPLRAGVVLVSEIASAGFAASGSQSQHEPGARRAPSLPEPQQELETELEPAVEEPAVEEPAVEEPAVEEPEVESDEVEDELEEQAPAAHDPAETLVEPGEEAYDALFGATIAGRTPEDAAVREVADPPVVQVSPPPGVVPDGEVADSGEAVSHSTMTPVEFARLRASRAGRATPVVVAPAAPASIEPPPVLHFSTGREVVVDRPVFIGRAPRAASTSGGPAPTPVVLDDPYLSSTHLEVAVVVGVLTATDRSTNGTVLIAPGAPPVPLVKDLPTPVANDSVLRITDQLTVRVVRG